jgi:hypothetical protein
MNTQDLIEKAIAKATGVSQNDVHAAAYLPITLKEVKDALQWALDEQVNKILGSLIEQLDDMTDPRDMKHTYGFELAINLINDNFTE